MEQLALLQNQFPVEEVKIDITFKYKLFICNIYIYTYKTHVLYCMRCHKKIYWLLYGSMKTQVTSFYEVLGVEHIVSSFEKLRKMSTTIMDCLYYNVLQSVPKLQAYSKSESADAEKLKKKNSIKRMG